MVKNYINKKKYKITTKVNIINYSLKISKLCN